MWPEGKFLTVQVTFVALSVTFLAISTLLGCIIFVRLLNKLTSFEVFSMISSKQLKKTTFFNSESGRLISLQSPK